MKCLSMQGCSQCPFNPCDTPVAQCGASMPMALLGNGQYGAAVLQDWPVRAEHPAQARQHAAGCVAGAFGVESLAGAVALGLPTILKPFVTPGEAVRVACKPGAAQSGKRRQAGKKHGEHSRSCRAAPQPDGAWGLTTAGLRAVWELASPYLQRSGSRPLRSTACSAGGSRTWMRKPGLTKSDIRKLVSKVW